MAMEAYRSVPIRWTGAIGGLAGRGQTHRMDSQPMNRWVRRGLTVPFIAGMIFFAYPIVMVFDRRPIVEQTDFHTDPDVLHPGQKFETVWTIETFRPRCNGYT